MCFLDPEPSKSPATAESSGKNWSRSPSKPLHHRPKANSCQAEKRYITECHKLKGMNRLARSTLPLSWANSLSVAPRGTSSCAAIPSCSQSDPRRWKRIQCDTESTLCWCVNPMSGDYDYHYRVKTGKDKSSKLKCR